MRERLHAERKDLRPTGVEPISSAPEADALSIELRAHKSISILLKLDMLCVVCWDTTNFMH